MLIKGYDFAQISPRCVVKVDMMKAYDLVSWFIFRRVLEELNFTNQFVEWIMWCITTFSYMILINGCPSKKFKATQGLWQCDPLSSYLFAISMEYLSRSFRGWKIMCLSFTLDVIRSS